jgi:hypothetical protein
MNQLVKKLDDITIEDIANIDLNKINFISSNNNLRHDIDQMPGVEHYRLLCYLSTLVNNTYIYELGTWTGGSALCLAYNKSNYVISYDIKYLVEVERQPNVEYRQGDFTHDKQLLQSPLIFIDVTHDGDLERQIYNYLIDNNYKGVTIWDDINLNSEMKKFWMSVTHEKRDLTKWGHYSGTGVIIF